MGKIVVVRSASQEGLLRETEFGPSNAAWCTDKSFRGRNHYQVQRFTDQNYCTVQPFTAALLLALNLSDDLRPKEKSYRGHTFCARQKYRNLLTGCIAG
jgi:hypothetical protein